MNKIREWRKNKNLTLEQVSELWACSVSQLSEVELGKNGFSAKKINEILKITPELAFSDFFPAEAQ